MIKNKEKIERSIIADNNKKKEETHVKEWFL